MYTPQQHLVTKRRGGTAGRRTAPASHLAPRPRTVERGRAVRR
jgi:hypothetical protein